MGIGKLIVIEGACDGIGKSTQFNLLKEHLEKDGKKVVNHHFPTYDDYQGLPAINFLKGEFGNPNELSPHFIASLYGIDRAITWRKKLKKAYDNGDIILLDRYTSSNLIYQSSYYDDIEEKKEFMHWVNDFEHDKLGLGRPDMVIFLDAPYEIVQQLRNNRNDSTGKSDIYESNEQIMKKATENSRFVADYFSWNKIECNNGNEMKSIEEIHNEIYKVVSTIL